jgi:hypothetical protein
MLSRTLRCARWAALCLCLLPPAVGSVRAAAEPADPLVEPVQNAAALHARLTTGQMKAAGIPFSPCFPTRATPFSMVRPSDGPWAGEFSVTAAGAGGQWRMKVEALDKTRTREYPLSVGTFTTDVFNGGVRISLLGAGAPCARVRLERELEQVGRADARGQSGPDDRWETQDARLSAEPDAQSIRRWGASIAHLRILTSTHYLIPCTGFFITPRVLVTAAHCIGSRRDVPTATVFLDGNEIPGAEFDLLMAQGDELDFTLLWRKGATAATPSLRVGTDKDPRLLLWQQPQLTKKVVSVKDCGLREPISGRRRIAHECDTEAGSSGSPVQSRATGAVIGLHTVGCNPAQNLTKDCVNYAINFEDIRKRVLEKEKPLRARNAEAAAEVIAALGP